MTEENAPCPLCDGAATSEAKEGSQFVRFRCTASCSNEFLIGSTALRRLVGWSLGNEAPALSIENRSGWGLD
jgi:hypothetical protein